MLGKQILLTALDYSEWAGRRLLAACAGVSDSSILLNVRHTFYADRVWLRRLEAGELPPLIEMGNQNLFRDPDPEPDLATIAANWPEVWDGLRRWVERAAEADLERELACTMPDGTVLRVPQWKLILHNVNHSSLHRGQVMAMLRALGVKPPGIDLFGYYLDGPPKRSSRAQ